MYPLRRRNVRIVLELGQVSGLNTQDDFSYHSTASCLPYRHISHTVLVRRRTGQRRLCCRISYPQRDLCRCKSGTARDINRRGIHTVLRVNTRDGIQVKQLVQQDVAAREPGLEVCLIGFEVGQSIMLLFDSHLEVHALVADDDSRPREFVGRIGEWVGIVAEEVTTSTLWLEVIA